MPRNLRQVQAALPPMGSVLGRCDLPPAVVEAAADLARGYFGRCESMDFCQDPVETLEVPAWMAERDSWFPAEQLRTLGLERAPLQPSTAEQLVMTLGVDPHQDFHGPTLLMVLHNDGLRFKQRGQSHVTKIGEWFVFNDRAPHSVRETKNSTVYICWSVPLRAISRQP